MCPVQVKPAVLQWYGYVAAGGGFHCLEMDETVLAANVAEQENAATVIINDVDPRSKLSVQLLSDDLKRLVDANWDWQVKRTSDSDFSVVFPNSASLNLCKNTHPSHQQGLCVVCGSQGGSRGLGLACQGLAAVVGCSRGPASR
jgi:hypothetical protein